MNKDTKVTSASVRIMISHNYSNFESAMTLENPNGIDQADIEEARKTCQSITNNAVAEFKLNPNLDPKKELENLDKKLDVIKQHINKQKDNGSILTRQE